MPNRSPSSADIFAVVIAVLGVVAVVAGVALWSPAAALITFGACLLAAAYTIRYMEVQE